MTAIDQIDNVNGLLALVKFKDKMKAVSLIHLFTKITQGIQRESSLD